MLDQCWNDQAESSQRHFLFYLCSLSFPWDPLARHALFDASRTDGLMWWISVCWWCCDVCDVGRRCFELPLDWQLDLTLFCYCCHNYYGNWCQILLMVINSLISTLFHSFGVPFTTSQRLHSKQHPKCIKMVWHVVASLVLGCVSTSDDRRMRVLRQWFDVDTFCVWSLAPSKCAWKLNSSIRLPVFCSRLLRDCGSVCALNYSPPATAVRSVLISCSAIVVRCVLQLIAARCYQSVLISSCSAFGGGALFGNPRPCICVRRLPGEFGHPVVNCTECVGVGCYQQYFCMQQVGVVSWWFVWYLLCNIV